MEKQEMLYEGKAKRIYTTTDRELLWVEYKDDATAFNGKKKGSIADKGKLNNVISSILFAMLSQQGIPNHFVRSLSDHEQLVKKVSIVPIEVVVRNIVAGSLAKRLGLEEGVKLTQPVIELYYKDDDLGDPLINEDHIRCLEMASRDQVKQMKEMALQVNDELIPYFKERNIILVDYKLEFGITPAGELILADEISPDTCRLWDAVSHEKMDKDRFRHDLGQVEEAYQEILTRLGGVDHV